MVAHNLLRDDLSRRFWVRRSCIVARIAIPTPLCAFLSPDGSRGNLWKYKFTARNRCRRMRSESTGGMSKNLADIGM